MPRPPVRSDRRVAIATSRDFPDLTTDDRHLLPALSALGIRGVPAVWDAPGIRWEDFDAVLIRSTWSYYLDRPAFLKWIRRVDDRSTLWNPATVIRWNCHKSYLLDLEKHGVPIIPTALLGGPDEIVPTLEKRSWDRAVVKPAVSAGAYQTHLLHREKVRSELRRMRGLEGVGQLLLQPYVPEVERAGERSIVFIDQRYSHAFLRAPKLGENPALKEGSAYRPQPGELAVARRAIRCSPAPTLYARVDLVPDGDGPPRVMEVEMIEPALWLGNSPSGLRRFARGIRDRLRR